MNSPVRLAMIGGGDGAFIGEVHRMAARLDGHYQLVAGAFNSDPARSRASAEHLGLAAGRGYADVDALIAGERGREDDAEVVTIVTPNHLHFDAASKLLAAGFHVICDKPMTTTAADAQALQEQVTKSGRLFMVTYNYSGYAMVREARARIAQGELGAVRIVQVEYPQDWLARNIERDGQKQASWRTDPTKAGPGGCLGDIGTHAFHLAEYISGQQVQSVLADLTSVVPGRRLDDNAQVLLRFGNGCRGALWASQVAIGHNNGLRVRVYGEDGSLAWYQEAPEQLSISMFGQPAQVLYRGGAGSAHSADLGRIPAGHPEGFLEGFANLYRGFAAAVIARRAGDSVPLPPELPGIEAGLRGVKFVEQAVNSANRGSVWQTLD